MAAKLVAIATTCDDRCVAYVAASGGTGGVLQLSISGKVDEHFGQDAAHALKRFGVGRAELNLAAVESVSSLGLRELEQFIAGLLKIAQSVHLLELSPVVARQFAMIENLAPGAEVVSARLPFVCPSC